MGPVLIQTSQNLLETSHNYHTYSRLIIHAITQRVYLEFWHMLWRSVLTARSAKISPSLFTPLLPFFTPPSPSLKEPSDAVILKCATDKAPKEYKL